MANARSTDASLARLKSTPNSTTSKSPRAVFSDHSDDTLYRNFAVLAARDRRSSLSLRRSNRPDDRPGRDAYKIVGVIAERASTAAAGGSLAGQEYNRDVYIPLKTCRLRFGERILDFRSGRFTAEETELTQLTVQVHSTDEVAATATLLTSTYEPYHKEKDVQMTVPYDLLEQARAVGPSVQHHPGDDRLDLATRRRHRHHEHHACHGDRANPRDRSPPRSRRQARDIIHQFLIECVLLSGIGGLAGMLLGMWIPSVIVYFAPDQKPVITLQSVILAFGISVCVGILFGIYPARRAALMDPIEALRAE